MEAEVERALAALLAEGGPLDYAAVRDRVTPACPALPEPCFQAAGHGEALPTLLEVLDRESGDRA
jgi:hypothetical protein